VTQINATYTIAAETLKGVPDEIKNNIVLPLNLLNEQLVGAINNAQISTNDNTTSHVLTQNFQSGVMLVITNPLAGAPLGVSAIGGNGPNQYVESIWLTPQPDQTKLGVTLNWQPNTYSGPCTFRLEGG
jgi:hypothetical protein